MKQVNKVIIVSTDDGPEQALYIDGKLAEYDSHGLVAEQILDALEVSYKSVDISSSRYKKNDYEFPEEFKEEYIIYTYLERNYDCNA